MIVIITMDKQIVFGVEINLLIGLNLVLNNHAKICGTMSIKKFLSIGCEF